LGAKGFPMRIARENRLQHLVQHFATLIEWAKLDLPIDGDDLERRSRGGEIPARVSPGEFISGGKVYAAMRIQILQKTLQSILERDLGNDAGNSDTASSGISELAHNNTCMGNYQDNRYGRGFPLRAGSCYD